MSYDARAERLGNLWRVRLHSCFLITLKLASRYYRTVVVGYRLCSPRELHRRALCNRAITWPSNREHPRPVAFAQRCSAGSTHARRRTSRARLLPRDILAHIARIIRLNVLLDVNENGVSFIASECAAEPRSCPVLARAEIRRGTSQRTDSRQMLPEIPRDTFDVARRMTGPSQ